MNKLITQLIDKGLNPRFKWTGVSNFGLLCCKLKEFLPYCEITIKQIYDSSVVITIDFYKVKFNIQFNVKLKGSTFYIQEIIPIAEIYGED